MKGHGANLTSTMCFKKISTGIDSAYDITSDSIFQEWSLIFLKYWKQGSVSTHHMNLKSQYKLWEEIER